MRQDTRSRAMVPGLDVFDDLVAKDLGNRIRQQLLRLEPHYASEIITDTGRHLTPRLTSAYSDQTLTLEGMRTTSSWSPELAELRGLVAERLGVQFNYALANLYRDGSDYTGWHCDKAWLHTPGSSIAIVSFGATRAIEVRSMTGGPTVSTDLQDSSVALMDLPLQSTHEHRIPPDENCRGMRLSITLRNIVVEPQYLSKTLN